MRKKLTELLEKFNIKPNPNSMYELAFTHSSYNIDVKTIHQDYERLEFMGDSIIGFVIADLAFANYPEMGQGEMTKLRSFIVQGNSLANKARELEFDNYIKAGVSIKGQISSSNKLLEDVFEAFIGAVYFDQGMQFVYDLVTTIFKEAVLNFKSEQLQDYKSRLQEEVQSSERKSVFYELISEEGMPHDRTFTVRVKLNDSAVILGQGTGKSKKEAEQMAAKDALGKKAG